VDEAVCLRPSDVTLQANRHFTRDGKLLTAVPQKVESDLPALPWNLFDE